MKQRRYEFDVEQRLIDIEHADRWRHDGPPVFPMIVFSSDAARRSLPQG
jgi:hypothetical protein